MLRSWGLCCWFIGMLPLCCLGQSAAARWLSVEVGGVGGLGSINAEWALNGRANLQPVLRAGFSISPVDRNNGIALIFPVMMQGIWGRGSHHLETGVGQALSLTTRGNVFLRMPLHLGYRYQASGRRLFVGLAYTPLISWIFDRQWEHWAGIRLGYQLPGS